MKISKLEDLQCVATCSIEEAANLGISFTLLAHSVHTEKGVKRATINGALKAELQLVASWLGLRR